MSDTYSNRPIRPDLIAQKLQSIRNYEHEEILEEITERPRYVEMLWFLQFVSQPKQFPGGLKRFARELLEQSNDLLGTHAMQAAGPGDYGFEQIRAIVDGMPLKGKVALGIPRDPDSGYFFLSDDCEFPITDKEVTGRLAEALRKLSRSALIDVCLTEAVENLAQYLRDLCEQPQVRFTRPPKKSDTYYEPGTGAPWYFVRVADAVLRFMDRWKVDVSRSIAETEVSRLVFRWLGRAREMKRGIRIQGNSRYGKTEAVSAWCRMNPGLARLVDTPPSSSESDLLREVARALGIEMGLHQKGHQLREVIGFVLEESGLMLVFDEAQFLFPTSFSRNTAPARLNWVRRAVLDRRLPAVFVCTPQSYQSAKKRYVKATQYTIEQLDGRIGEAKNLPEEIPHEDLLAIARIHFAGLQEEYLEYVVSQADAAGRNYVSDVANIAAFAHQYARESGRSLPNFRDIKDAVKDALPTVVEPVATAQKPRCTPHADAVQPRCTSPATPLSRSIEEPEPEPTNRISVPRETRIADSPLTLSV